jgi:hypothetical protein
MDSQYSNGGRKITSTEVGTKHDRRQPRDKPEHEASQNENNRIGNRRSLRQRNHRNRDAEQNHMEPDGGERHRSWLLSVWLKTCTGALLRDSEAQPAAPCFEAT